MNRLNLSQESVNLVKQELQHFPAFYNAFQATMTERNIKSAFRGAGLIPFNPKSVVSKLDVQIQTPPPVEEIVPSTP